MSLPRLSTVQSADSHRKTATTINQLMATSSGAMSASSRAELSTAPKSSTVIFDGSPWTFDSSNLSTLVAADTQQGIYVAPASDTSGASGAWVRQYSGAVNVKWFGTAADGVTDDSAAFVAAVACLKSIASNDSGSTKGSPRLFIPAGSYYLGTTTLEITHTLIIEGEGSGQVGGIATMLRWAAGCVGIRFQAYNTTGNRVTGGATGYGADGSTLSRLFLKGGYAGVAGDSYHAVDTNVRITCEDVSTYLWQGNGFNIVATSGGGAGLEGNANGFALNRCSAYSCLNGLYVSGADVNAASIIALDVGNNRAWGVEDDGFLGNTYLGCQAAGNASGPYKTTNANALHTFSNCYSEGGQPTSQFSQLTLILGGQHAAGVVGGCYIAVNTDGRLTKWGEMELKANASTITENGVRLTLNSWATTAGIAFKYQDTQYADIGGISGTGLQYDVTAGLSHYFYSGASGYDATIGATGIDLPNAGRAYHVQGFQVVGPRQSGTAANASDLATAITLVNDLKAKLIAHGLIS